MSVFTHYGLWDQHSRSDPVLRFIEEYFRAIDSAHRSSIISSKLYAQSAIYHDSQGDAYISGPIVWDRIRQLLSPFSKVSHESVEIRVVPGTTGRSIVYAQLLTHFQLKGDVDEVVAPRFFVIHVGEAAKDEGTDGLQIYELSVFWDTGILGRYITERKKMNERRKVQRIEAIIN